MKIIVRATALAAFAAVAAPAFAAFDANIEFDNTYLNGADGSKRGLEQSGRVELNAFGKAGADWFIAGRASYLAQKTGGVATDDMWVQVGTAMADVKLGRFEAADLFPIPRDVLVLYAGGDVYRANTLRGRFGTGGDGRGVFHAAGTFNAGGGLSIELGFVEGSKFDANTTCTPTVPPAPPCDPTLDDVAGTNRGFRPVVTYAAGPLTLKAGIEAIKYGANNKSQTGYGLTAAYNIGGVTLIGNFASAKNAADEKQQTYGLIANADMGLAGGVIISKTDKAAVADYKTTTFYAAYNIPFFDIKGATISPAVSFSKGSGSNDADDQKGLRLRFNYTF